VPKFTNSGRDLLKLFKMQQSQFFTDSHRPTSVNHTHTLLFTQNLVRQTILQTNQCPKHVYAISGNKTPTLAQKYGHKQLAASLT